MTYSVKEIFYTLQGEGVNAGRPAVFCRFAGCNLWSGIERDRDTAICRFCDTDFVGTDGQGGGKFTKPNELAFAISSKWPIDDLLGQRLVVCTGGEPLLQIDEPLIDALHELHFIVAVETNGTQPAPKGIDWICVSPKANAPLVLDSGNEIKLIFPQKGIQPEMYSKMRFDHFFLQPMDGDNRVQNTRQAVDYCKEHPLWRLSLQIHKMLGIP